MREVHNQALPDHSHKTNENIGNILDAERREGQMSIRSEMGVDVGNRLDAKKREGQKSVGLGMSIGVRNASTRHKRVGGFRRECIVKTQTDLGWTQRVWDWQEVLGGGSDDSGMA